MSNNNSGGQMRAFWPVLGFVLAISFGVLAWALGPAGYEFLRDNRIVNFAASNVSRDVWEWVIRGVIFVILLMLASLIVAAARPRQVTDVREKDLAKERIQLRKDIRSKKELQRRINKQMKDR